MDKESKIRDLSSKEIYDLYLSKKNQLDEYVALIIEKDFEIEALKKNNQNLVTSNLKDKENFLNEIEELQNSLNSERKKVKMLQNKLKENKSSDQSQESVESPAQIKRTSPPRRAIIKEKKRQEIPPPPPKEEDKMEDEDFDEVSFLFPQSPRKRKRKEFETEGKSKVSSKTKESPKSRKRKKKKVFHPESVERPSIDFTLKVNERLSNYIQRIFQTFLRKYLFSSPKTNSTVDIFRNFFIGHVCSFFSYLKDKEIVTAINGPESQKSKSLKSTCLGFLNGLVELLKQKNSKRLTLYLDLFYLFIQEFCARPSDQNEMFPRKQKLILVVQVFTKLVLSKILSLISSPRTYETVRVLICSLCLFTEFLPFPLPLTRTIRGEVYSMILKKVILILKNMRNIANKKQRSEIMNHLGLLISGNGVEFLMFASQHSPILLLFLKNLMFVQGHPFFEFTYSLKYKKTLDVMRDSGDLLGHPIYQRIFSLEDEKREYLDYMYYVEFLESFLVDDFGLLSSFELELMNVLECFVSFFSWSWCDVFNKFLFGSFFDFCVSKFQKEKTFRWFKIWVFLVGPLVSTYYEFPKGRRKKLFFENIQKNKKISNFGGLFVIFRKLEVIWSLLEEENMKPVFTGEGVVEGMKVICLNSMIKVLQALNRRGVKKIGGNAVLRKLKYFHSKCLESHEMIRNFGYWCCPELQSVITKLGEDLIMKRIIKDGEEEEEEEDLLENSK